MHLIAALTLASIIASGVAWTPPDECHDAGPWSSTCSIANTGGHVEVGASQTNGGGSDGGAGGGSTDDDGSAGPTTPPSTHQEDPHGLGDRGNYSVGLVPRVAIHDLASFRPAAPSLTGEPTGFGVIGAPTNVLAAASEQTLAGEILDWPVTVRFTPAAYIFDYGDGTTARTTTGGASWPALGQAQFTPTATSHAYRARGIYPVSVTVQYSAAVNFGSGSWRPVPGFVTANTSGYSIHVVSARTALVDLTCLEDPSGPGC